MALLQIEKLTMRFGGITAVNRADITVEPGQIFSVIGPNGAGKTTVFNAVTGIYEPTEGRVLFRGRPVERPFVWKLFTWRPFAWQPFTWKPVAGAVAVGVLTGLVCLLLAVNVNALWKAAIRQNYTDSRTAFPWGKAVSDATSHIVDRGRTAAGGFALGFVVGGAGMLLTWWRSRRTPDVISQGGIARTFQNIRLFQAMTVLENVQVGMSRAIKGHPLAALLHLPAHRREEAEFRAKAGEMLAFVGLAGKHNELACNLAYGDQRRLEIARALATGPELLLLDEPAAGMNPSETATLMELIRKIRDRGVTVLLIEHHMSLVMGISDRVAVLDYGVKIAEEPPAEVSRDPKVIEAYLGKEEVS